MEGYSVLTYTLPVLEWTIYNPRDLYSYKCGLKITINRKYEVRDRRDSFLTLFTYNLLIWLLISHFFLSSPKRNFLKRTFYKRRKRGSVVRSEFKDYERSRIYHNRTPVHLTLLYRHRKLVGHGWKLNQLISWLNQSLVTKHTIRI